MLSVRVEEDGLYEGQNRTVAEEVSGSKSSLSVRPLYFLG